MIQWYSVCPQGLSLDPLRQLLYASSPSAMASLAELQESTGFDVFQELMCESPNVECILDMSGKGSHLHVLRRT